MSPNFNIACQAEFSAEKNWQDGQNNQACLARSNVDRQGQSPTQQAKTANRFINFTSEQLAPWRHHKLIYKEGPVRCLNLCPGSPIPSKTWMNKGSEQPPQRIRARVVGMKQSTTTTTTKIRRRPSSAGDQDFNAAFKAHG
jgi:hypothetical protein